MSFSVKLHNVTKRYKMHSKKSDKLKSLFSTGSSENDFYAVRNISFEARPGDIVGVIGINGSGKSTISNLIANVTAPTYGSITVRGEVALIAVSAGLNKELTGRENIELKCLMMGIKKEEIKDLEPEIIDFADIGKFIDMPVKKYSSGMRSRLGFAISVSVDPDVLIIDEALSVGDQTFADKCLDKLNEFKAQGKTIFFVSHSAAQVRSFCTKAVWLEHGEVRDQGDIHEVLPKYTEFINDYKKMSKKDQQAFKEQGISKQAEVKEATVSKEKLKKKKRRKRKKAVKNTLLTIFMLILVSFTYMSKNDITEYVNALTTSNVQVEKTISDKEENDVVETTENSTENTDTEARYVTEPEGAVLKSSPDAESEDSGNVMFSESLLVLEKEKDTNGEEWLKVSVDNNKKAWIQEDSTSEITSPSYTEEEVEEVFISETKPLIDLSKNELGKSKVVLDRNYGEPLLVGNEYRYSNGLMAVFGEDSKAEKFIIEDIDVAVANLKGELGDPDLESGSTLMLYHTADYDYSFRSSDGVNVDTVEIYHAL
ncbi:teichoic acids export ABC transporter ATP-binding subunit TagH [Bacillus sp. SB49]|uniref:teichoic acids export ABC transporter ATP-binding subunit TagH n=1 Tax=Bacillus sp. SB49 TaxID=1071080 RepID=UPI000419AB44|nr:teichoic acids export ABC transporter ATP-binding subunit TagH [Bacillus sp. SB49]QHT48035.1 teichoic acids export ABC transporter ATP-binding subunit TagH [Bacillus sp. SB49]